MGAESGPDEEAAEEETSGAAPVSPFICWMLKLMAMRLQDRLTVNRSS